MATMEEHNEHVVDMVVKAMGITGMADATDELRRVIDKLFNADSLNPTGKANRKLHHYLGATALRGFLTAAPEEKGRRRLWASLATHLNDHQELLHGQRIVLTQLKAYCAAERNEPAKQYFARLKDAEIDWEKKLRPDVPWADIFVTSLTERGDRLSMWRGYTDQRGYALTFEVTGWPQTVFLAKVMYDNNVSHLPTTFDALFTFYKNLPARPKEGDTEQKLFEGLKSALGLVAAIYKAKQWREEREWRLIQWCDQASHIKFRERQGRLIPYHEIALPRELQIKRITFGPGYHRATERRALKMICKADLEDVKVRGSKVPLRID